MSLPSSTSKFSLIYFILTIYILRKELGSLNCFEETNRDVELKFTLGGAKNIFHISQRYISTLHCAEHIELLF
jgi:hypothetical protein